MRCVGCYGGWRFRRGRDTRLQRLGGGEFGLDGFVAGFQLRGMLIGRDSFGGAIPLQQGITLGQQQLHVVGLRLQGILTGADIREPRATKLIARELRNFRGLCEALNVRLFRDEAAHITELGCNFRVAGERFLQGVQNADGFLVTALIDQRIGQPHAGAGLIRLALYRRRCIDNRLGVFATLTGRSRQGASVGISLCRGRPAV
jgi:hypothetical protein